METHNKHHTPTHMGMVFIGMGIKKYIWGLLLLLPIMAAVWGAVMLADMGIIQLQRGQQWHGRVMGIVGCVPGRYPPAGVSQCPLSVVHYLLFIICPSSFMVCGSSSVVYLSRSRGVWGHFII
jgi:hypothetical protein